MTLSFAPACRLTAALSAVLAFLAAPPLLLAQAAPKVACTDPIHHQFDFWIGDWDVTLPDGSKAGHNLIEPILGGCALRESWTGARGANGTSTNAFDRVRGKWHQTWVDDGGSLIMLDGAFAEGKMVLTGETKDTAGKKVINRITWQETAPGAVRQLWEASRDGGSTWNVLFDGRYKKRA